MKKISIITTIILIIIILLLYIGIIDKKSNSKIENNIVKITKEEEISKINKNPSGVFNDNYNLKKNIFSGFFINKNTILTIAHGVNSKNSTYIIEDGYGNNYNGKLKYKSTKNDYAILRIEKKLNNIYDYKISNDYKIGDIVYSISFGKNKIKKIRGKIQNINKNIINTDIKLVSGDSGGILVDEKNNLIAINNGYNIENNYSISTKIKDIIENNQ